MSAGFYLFGTFVAQIDWCCTDILVPHQFIGDLGVQRNFCHTKFFGFTPLIGVRECK